jgi:hypothetical protein
MPSVVQTAAGTGGVYTSAGSFASNVTAGSTVFLIVDGDGLGGTPSTSSPTIGGVTPAGSVQVYPDTADSGSFNDAGTMWMMPNVAGGNNNFGITATHYGSNGVCGVLAIEVAGLGPAPVIGGQSVGNANHSGQPDSGSITTTVANAILIGQLVQDGGLTAGPGLQWTGFSIADPTPQAGGYHDNSNGYYQIVSSTGTYSITGANSSPGSSAWVTGIAAVYASPVSQPLQQSPPIYQQRIR